LSRALADAFAPSYLIAVGRKAMACEFEVLLNAKQHPQGEEAACEALDLVTQLEEQLSVYIETSEVSRLNRAAGERAVAVEPRLFGLLQAAAELSGATGGAFDVTAGPLIKAWGFFRRQGRVPSEEELAAALAGVGMPHVALDAAERSVRFLTPGMEINLGSIGKGYALDRAAERLDGAGLGDYLLHGGQSSLVARGNRAGKGSERGWRVAIRHPLRPGQPLGEVRLADRALATSGSGTQYFHHGGKRFGHLLDPRTGRPAEGVLSSSVLAPTAAEADALSTAFYVLGPRRAREIAAQREGVAFVLVTPSERKGGVDVHLHGLAEGEWMSGS
jgi:thiamine biosynthesis lipoprotein